MYKMVKGKLTLEFEEMRDFMDFVVRTGRLENIEHIDKYIHPRTPDCIHILEDFSATATEQHPNIAKHLKKLDQDYTPYREHALNCKRCQASLDTIFTFTGYKNKSLFPETIQKILTREWELDSSSNVYLCKLPAPGFNYSELTYITSVPLQAAIKDFEKKIREPLNLSPFEEVRYKTKTSNKGLGIKYVQAYLYPKDKSDKTKISLRSRIR